MCGRFALHANPEVVALQFGLRSVPVLEAHYNIAPASSILIIRNQEAATARWGLVPRWAKDPSIGAKLNNARAETVAQKPSFRDAYRKRRCLIPASGFYEWKLESGRKQPYYVRPAQGELFAFAGLWERWNGFETCAVITTDANETMRAIHDRMPVIVAREDYERWLAGNEGLLRPCPSSTIAIQRVSRAVNSARNDSPDLIRPEEG
jgi:putative SOS response-associated peptidase YedK